MDRFQTTSEINKLKHNLTSTATALRLNSAMQHLESLELQRFYVLFYASEEKIKLVDGLMKHSMSTKDFNVRLNSLSDKRAKDLTAADEVIKKSFENVESALREHEAAVDKDKEILGQIKSYEQLISDEEKAHKTKMGYPDVTVTLNSSTSRRTEYKVIGPENQVKKWFESMYQQWNPSGYGTHGTIKRRLPNGNVEGELYHYNNCD